MRTGLPTVKAYIVLTYITLEECYLLCNPAAIGSIRACGVSN